MSLFDSQAIAHLGDLCRFCKYAPEISRPGLESNQRQAIVRPLATVTASSNLHPGLAGWESASKGQVVGRQSSQQRLYEPIAGIGRL